MRKIRLIAALSIALSIGSACSGDRPPGPSDADGALSALPPMPSRGNPVALPDDPRRAFDFWVGTWDVRNKHLRQGAWVDSGSAVARIESILDGGAVLERWAGELGGNPLIGFSVRAYDPETKRWPVYLNWHGGRPGGFSLMVGERNGERMELFPPGEVRSPRYSFSQPHDDSCQWDQATSEDEGQTWTTDWIMQFLRREPAAAIDATNAPIAGPPESAHHFPETRALDFLLGAWQGPARVRMADGTWKETTSTARIGSMIEGFGILQFVDDGLGGKRFAAFGFDARVGDWIAIAGHNGLPGLRKLRGSLGPSAVEWVEDGMKGSPEEDRPTVTLRWECDTPRSCRLSRSVGDPVFVAELRKIDSPQSPSQVKP